MKMYWIKWALFAGLLMTAVGADAASWRYCYTINGQTICFDIPVEVKPWWEDFPPFWNDDLINPAVLTDLVYLNQIDVLAGQLDRHAAKRMHESLVATAGTLRLPSQVRLVPSASAGPDPTPWRLQHLASNKRTISRSLAAFANHILEPDPEPWIIDNALDPSVALDLRHLATMDALAEQLSPATQEAVQFSIREMVGGLDLPADVNVEFLLR